MRLIFTNNLTKVETILEVNDNNISTKFWNFNISLPAGMEDGEYTYTLMDDEDNVASTGLLQIGDYTATKTEYKEKEDYVIYGEE